MHDEIFYGYCLTPQGYWTPRAKLNGAEVAWHYAYLNAQLWHEVRITDTGDFLNIHVVDHKLVYPTEKEGFPAEIIKRFNERKL